LSLGLGHSRPEPAPVPSQAHIFPVRRELISQSPVSKSLE